MEIKKGYIYTPHGTYLLISFADSDGKQNLVDYPRQHDHKNHLRLHKHKK